MLTYKEFEIIKTLMQCEELPDAGYIHDHIYFELFNSKEAPTKMGTFPQYDHPHTLRRYAEIAESLGIAGKDDSEKLQGLLNKIDELKAAIEIKPTIRDYVPDEEAFLSTLDEMSEQAFDDQCTGANPRYPLISEIKQMYLNAYYGEHQDI